MLQIRKKDKMVKKIEIGKSDISGSLDKIVKLNKNLRDPVFFEDISDDIVKYFEYSVYFEERYNSEAIRRRASKQDLNYKLHTHINCQYFIYNLDTDEITFDTINPEDKKFFIKRVVLGKIEILDLISGESRLTKTKKFLKFLGGEDGKMFEVLDKNNFVEFIRGIISRKFQTYLNSLMKDGKIEKVLVGNSEVNVFPFYLSDDEDYKQDFFENNLLFNHYLRKENDLTQMLDKYSFLQKYLDSEIGKLYEFDLKMDENRYSWFDNLFDNCDACGVDFTKVLLYNLDKWIDSNQNNMKNKSYIFTYNIRDLVKFLFKDKVYSQIFDADKDISSQADWIEIRERLSTILYQGYIKNNCLRVFEKPQLEFHQDTFYSRDDLHDVIKTDYNQCLLYRLTEVYFNCPSIAKGSLVEFDLFDLIHRLSETFFAAEVVDQSTEESTNKVVSFLIDKVFKQAITSGYKIKIKLVKQDSSSDVVNIKGLFDSPKKEEETFWLEFWNNLTSLDEKLKKNIYLDEKELAVVKTVSSLSEKSNFSDLALEEHFSLKS